ETVIRRIIDSGPNADNFLKLVESFIGRNALRASAPYQDHIQRISLAVEFERDPLARIKEEPFRSYVAEGDARFVSPYALAASRAALGSRGSTHIEWDTVLLGITKTSYLATKIDAVINLCYSQPPPQFWSVALDILTNDF